MRRAGSGAGAEFPPEGDVNLSPARAAWNAQRDAATRALLEEDARYFLHQSLSTPCLNVLAGANGSTLTDMQGRKFLDFHGNNVHHAGFGHPRIIEAVRAQMEALPFCPRRYTNVPAIRLARRLVELAPGDLNRVLFAPGGTSAIGIALKLARAATRRHKTISLWDSFHARHWTQFQSAARRCSGKAWSLCCRALCTSHHPILRIAHSTAARSAR